MAMNYNPKTVTNGLVLCLDAANSKSWSQNVHPSPLDLGTWATNGNNATLTRDTTVTDSPVRGIPLKMAITGTDPYTSTYSNSIWNLAPAASGQTWTASVYVKASAATEGTIFLFEANSSGNYTNLSTNVVSITTSWTRISVTRTLTDATTAYVQARLDGPDAGGVGINIWWDGFQIERASSPTTFNSRTNTNGISWYDITGNNVNGTLTNGPTYSALNNGYITFDGSNDYIDLGNNLANLTTLTLECLIRFNTQISNYNGIISKTLDNTDGYELRTTTFSSTTTNIEFRYKGDNAGSGGYTVTNGVWYHICCTGQSGAQRLYINGSLVLSGSAATTPTANSNNLVIAKLAYAGLYLNALISAVKIYNRALTDSEVFQNFQAVRGRYGI